MAEKVRDKEALEAFAPQIWTKSTLGFENNKAYVACHQFLELWTRRNFGHMHDAMVSLMRENDGSGPAKIRQAFSGHQLESFQICRLDFTAAAVCIITVRLTIDGEEYERPLRWLRENERNEAAAIGRPGTWRLMTWGADYILNDE
jgi:hypothetical protein